MSTRAVCSSMLFASVSPFFWMSASMEAVSPSPASQRLYSLSATFWRYLLAFSSFVYLSAMVSARVLPLPEDFLPEDAVEAPVLSSGRYGSYRLRIAASRSFESVGRPRAPPSFSFRLETSPVPTFVTASVQDILPFRTCWATDSTMLFCRSGLAVRSFFPGMRMGESSAFSASFFAASYFES